MNGTTSPGDNYGGPVKGADAGPAAAGPRTGFAWVALRQWRTVLAVAALCVAGALAYLAVTPQQYTATARLYVQQKGPRLIGDANAGAGRESSSNANFLNAEREFITSTPVLAIAMGSDALKGMKVFEGVENPIALLKESLEVEVGKRDDIIAVSFACPDREEAARVVQAVVDAYVASQTRQRNTAISSQIKVVNDQKEKYEAEIEAISKSMVSLAGADITADPKDSPVMARYRKLNEVWTSANLELMAAANSYREAMAAYPKDEARAKALEDLEASGGVSIAGEQETARLRAGIFELEQKLDELGRVYLPQHPQVKSLQARLDHLRATYVITAKRRLHLAQEMEGPVRESLEKAKQAAEGHMANASKYAMLADQIKPMRAAVDERNKRIAELQAEADAGALNVSVVEPARAEERASKPDRKRVLAVALVSGLLAGIAAGLGREWMAPRMHSALEVRSALNLPVLGMVPAMSSKQSDSIRGQKVRFNPTSETAEAYRSVRTAVQFASPDGAPRTLLITSPQLGDGKTTLVSNYSIVAAQAGKRVLLIDADFRQPAQHDVFDLEGRPGLSSVLGGEATLDKAIQRTGIDRLDVLTSGPIPPNAPELLNSQRFLDLLDDLSTKYDQIVLDAPAVTTGSEARVIAASCDATLLVVRNAKTDRRLAEQACDGLTSVGARLLGVVLNDVNAGAEPDAGYFDAGTRPTPPTTPPTPEPPTPSKPTLADNGRISNVA